MGEEEEKHGLRAALNDPTDCQTCELCGALHDLRLCGRCRLIWYCNREHQVKDWKRHKAFCKHAANVSDQNHSNNTTTTTIAAAAEDVKHHLNDQNKHSDKKPDLHSANHQSNGDKLPDSNTAEVLDPSKENATEKIMAKGKIPGLIDADMPAFTCDKENKHTRPKSLSDYIVKSLSDYGLCVIDNFLGPDLGSKILAEVMQLHGSGHFEDGQLATSADGGRSNKKVRGDKITWTEKNEPGKENISVLIHKLDNLIMACSSKFGNQKIGGRTKAMVACYPGEGTYYMKHIDNANQDGRCITSIYYLNKDWDVSRDGGLLRIFPSNLKQVADIEPQFDRMLFFWSDRRNPHEVKPAFRTRYAITVWYFDQDERERAKLNYQLSKMNAGATPSPDVSIEF